MYLLFKEQLLKMMKGDARRDFANELGLKISPEYQFGDKKEYTIAKVLNETKAQKYINHADTEVLNTTQANIKIDELHEYTYSISSENLVQANLSQLVKDSQIDLSEMAPEWTSRQEAEWLYNHGVSGIKKSLKPPHFED